MTLDDICRHFGIRTDYGARGPVPEATKQTILKALAADPAALPDPPATEPVTAPAGVHCHTPEWLTDNPAWGIFCQLYELRSDRNWGIGDFGDLSELCRIAAGAGADFLGVNPVHALFPAAPMRRSPFMPSNRQFLNAIYIAMDDLPGHTQADGDELAALRTADLVDYDAVWKLKLDALRVVFTTRPFDNTRFARSRFEAFVSAGGMELASHALFDALSMNLVTQGHGEGWTSWPEPYRSRHGPTVAKFAQEHTKEVEFHLWLQWIASLQLSKAQADARGAGMRIGIYLDLAVGEALDGSATWSAPETVLGDLTIGAPPDVFSQSGQNWDLAAPSPTAMATDDFRMFRALIRAQLRHAGALRIDHAMALWQLFLIPMDQEASTGAHLRYPFADLLRVLAEESERAGAIMIGEDLGFVPRGFRETMQSARLLGYRILYFEQASGEFNSGDSYPQMALACLSTHDLPTLAEWWRGADTSLRQQFGLIDTETAKADQVRRHSEKRALVTALKNDGQLDVRARDAAADELPHHVLIALHRFLAGTPCLLTAVRLADLIGPAEATNVPGTMDEYPNWQKRAPVSLDAIATTSAFKIVTAAMRELRPAGNVSRAHQNPGPPEDS